jgi:hypothetical protein
VKKGDVSAVGKVILPRGAAYVFGAGIGGTNAGNGASVPARRIPAC